MFTEGFHLGKLGGDAQHKLFTSGVPSEPVSKKMPAVFADP